MYRAKVVCQECGYTLFPDEGSFDVRDFNVYVIVECDECYTENELTYELMDIVIA